jgi:ubiquinone/menaquinone biosynthesis C-methylase UbiE
MNIWDKYCVGEGLEIGGAAHNSFNLNTKNVDIVSPEYQVYADAQTKLCGKVLPVDIQADASDIPVLNNSYDFIISSHLLEHVANPIKVLKEWDRIIKPGGIIFMIIPHKERTFDRSKKRTSLSHLIKDQYNDTKGDMGHTHVWITQDIINLVNYMILTGMKWKLKEVEDTDSKVGNGFTIVIEKLKES